MAIGLLTAGASAADENGSFAQDVADTVNATLGLDGVKALPIPDEEYEDSPAYRINGFYSGSTVGGGVFVFKPSLAKSSHNGGTIIAPEAIAAWDGTSADLASLLNWSGSGSGCYVRINTSFVYLEDFGVVYADQSAASSNVLAWNAAVGSLVENSTVAAHEGVIFFNSELELRKGFVEIAFQAEIAAADSFAGERLMSIYAEQDFQYYRPPVLTGRLYLNCRGICRGLYADSMDHFNWNNVRVEGALGYSLRMDRAREGTIAAINVINSFAREAFASPSYWSSATSYTVGQRVRVFDPAWSVATVYVAGDIVSKSSKRFIAISPTTGQDPEVASLLWKEIPNEDYQCLVANTNKNPQSNNTNATLLANRVWQKVYQDEACIEILDLNLLGDRSNQINLAWPIIRDCGNKCYIRVDSSKLPARPVTHFNIWGGHIHGQPIAQAGGDIPIPNNQRMIELGYVANVNIDGTNIRCGDGEKCIGVMIGDGGTTKLSQNIRIVKSSVSGDGGNDAGIIVMPSVVASLDSQLDSAFAVTSPTANDLFDPRRIFRRNYRSEQRCLVPAGLNTVPGGFTVVGRAEYSTSRPYSYSVDSEVNPRFDLQVTSSNTQFRFSNGTDSPDVLLGRTAASTLSLASGASFQVAGGRWDTGQLLVNVRRMWLDTLSYLRVKSSAPVSEKDGSAIQTSRNSSTAGRPALSGSNDIGIMHFDTTLGKPIWFDGTVWKDAAGTTV